MLVWETRALILALPRSCSLPHTVSRPVPGPADGKRILCGSLAQLQHLDFLISSLRGLGLIAEDPFCSNTLLAQLLVIMVTSLRLVVYMGILVQLWGQADLWMSSKLPQNVCLVSEVGCTPHQVCCWLFSGGRAVSINWLLAPF